MIDECRDDWAGWRDFYAPRADDAQRSNAFFAFRRAAGHARRVDVNLQSPDSTRVEPTEEVREASMKQLKVLGHMD
jgi:hypothetical protein